MKRLTIVVETEMQARRILRTLERAEERGVLDFAFSAKVEDGEVCVVCGNPARPYSSHCSPCLAKLPKD